MERFLRSLFPAIGKDFASHFLQTEEFFLQIALKYDLIYAQSGYVYTVLLDLPRPSGANTPGESHATEGIVGSISHSYTHPPMCYSFPQGGTKSSNTFPPPNIMYLGHDMPHAFSQPHPPMPGPAISQPVYLNVAQPPYYPYP